MAPIHPDVGAGAIQQEEADDYVLLTLGNASAVSLEVNGRPFALPSGSTRVVRGLRIDRAAAGLEDPPAGTS